MTKLISPSVDNSCIQWHENLKEMNKRDAKNGSEVCKQMKPWIYNVIQRLSFQNNYKLIYL